MSESVARAIDTSVAIPLLVASHEAHATVAHWARGKTLHLCGHSLMETYAVLTRLPGDARVLPVDAVALIDDAFVDHLATPQDGVHGIHRELAHAGVAGGATYDGMTALVARSHDQILATRDARARATYEALGARVELIVANEAA